MAAGKVIERLIVQLAIATSPLTKGLKKAEKELTGFQKTLQDHGKYAARSFTVAAVGISAGLGLAVNQAVKFEDEMNRVGTVTNASAQDLKKMETMAMGLASQFGVSAHDIAKGMEEMARRGFSAEKIMKAFPSILKATIATGEGFNTVLRTTESLLLEFQMSADETGRVADVLSKTAAITAANMSRMGEAFKYSAPVAYQLGIKLEHLAAATGIMINSGIQGSSAGRLLGSSLLRLARPTEAAQIQLQKLGVQIADEKGNMIGLDKIIGQLHNSTKDMGNIQRIAALEIIFGKEAVKALLPVIEKGPAVFNKLSDSINKSGGTADKLADKMGNSLAAQFRKLKADVINLAILFGRTLIPVLRKIVGIVKIVVKWFSELNPVTKTVITTMLSFGASILFVLAAISKLNKVIKYFVGPLKMITDVFKKFTFVAGSYGPAHSINIFGRALSALAGPVGIAIGALTLLPPAIDAIKKKYAETKKVLEEKVNPKTIDLKVNPIPPKKNIIDKLFPKKIDVKINVPDVSKEEQSLERTRKKLSDLAKENDNLNKKSTSAWNNLKKEWSTTANTWINKINEVIRKERELTQVSESEKNRRLEQKRLEKFATVNIWETIRNAIERAKLAVIGFGQALAKLLRGDWAGFKKEIGLGGGAAPKTPAAPRPPYKPSTPSPFSMPWQKLGATTNYTANITQLSSNPRQTANYLDRHWMMSGVYNV